MDRQTACEEAWKRGYARGREETEALLRSAEAARTELAIRLIRAEKLAEERKRE